MMPAGALVLAAALALATAAEPPRKPTDVPGGRPPAPTAPARNPSDTWNARLDSSGVLKAMASELRRSLDSLRLKGSPRPYFLSYLLWDMQAHHMQASMGSCELSEPERQHLLETDLRVGDYAQDNTNFQGGMVFGPRLRLPMPQENDTSLIRLSLWAATDAKYKVAVEQLAQKRAFLANHSGRDTLPDFSRQQLLRQAAGDEPSPPDTAALARLGRELSKYLAGTTWLNESRVGYQYYFTTFYYVDSEGARYLQTVKEHTLLVSLLTQAADGEPLWDYLRVATREPLEAGKGAAAFPALKASVDSLLRRLDYLRKAPPLVNYRGPVLFTGTAAGELLNKALLAPQVRLREPLGAGAERNFLLSMAGRKLFPSGISIHDTPSLREHRGRALFGHYAFDHQGQPARDIALVEDGRVRGFYQGKVPVLQAKGHASNGHWRYGGGFPGVVILRSAQPVPEASLRSRLAAMGADEGNGFGLVVSKTLDEDAFKLLRHPLASQLLIQDAGGSRGTFAPPPPCEVDRIDSRTGKVTPVRGLAFPPIDSKSLRDIVAVGDEPHLHEPQAALSILCPSLLFSLLDLKGGRSTQPRLPYLP